MLPPSLPQKVLDRTPQLAYNPWLEWSSNVALEGSAATASEPYLRNCTGDAGIRWRNVPWWGRAPRRRRLAVREEWPGWQQERGEWALRRLSRRRRQARCLRQLRACLASQTWTWFWTQTFRPEFGVRSGKVILTWWMRLLESYMSEGMEAVFCVTEPHRRSGLWHAHMLVKQAKADPRSYREHKEWAFARCGIARIWPVDAGAGLDYLLKYVTKAKHPYLLRGYSDGKVPH